MAQAVQSIKVRCNGWLGVANAVQRRVSHLVCVEQPPAEADAAQRQDRGAAEHAGTSGAPALEAEGYLESLGTVSLSVSGALPSASGWHVVGLSRWDLPLVGGILIPAPNVVVPFAVDGAGESTWSTQLPPSIGAPLTLFVQSWTLDPGAAAGFAATDTETKALH